MQSQSGACLPSIGVVPDPVGVSSLAKFDLKHISHGRFTEETVKNMHKAVIAAKTDPRWRSEMLGIRQAGRRSGRVGWKDYLGEARHFDRHFRGPHLIDYVRDPHQVELVKNPWLTYKGQEGDCDDSAAMFAAALGVLGAPHRFRTWMADPSRPGEYTHVSAEVMIPGHGWVNEDLTVKGTWLGWKPGGFVTKVWPEPRWI
jgi:hypothetical protein